MKQRALAAAVVLLVASSSLFIQLGLGQTPFVRNDSYDFRGAHYLGARGENPGDFELFVESTSDFRIFKLHVSLRHLDLGHGPQWRAIRCMVDMNNDGEWELEWTIPEQSAVVTYLYPAPLNGLVSNHTIKVQIKYRNINNYEYTTTKYVQVTVFAQPRVYVNSEHDSFIQIGDEDPTNKIPVLMVEGFDPLNQKFPEVYYNLTWDLINNDLRPSGYVVFMLNFHDGGRDLRLNASVVLKAIEKIRQICPNHKIAIAGLSMGGVIGRYALAFAEQEGYVHDVGLFLSYDSPQYGAHVSPGLQDWIELQSPNQGAVGVLQANLQSVAAKQMLLYNTYDREHAFFNSFYIELNGLNGDGYPRQSYNVSVSNGNFNATYGPHDVGRHLMTLRVLTGNGSMLTHAVPAVSNDCATGSKITDIRMRRYGDVFHTPSFWFLIEPTNVYYELAFIFNPAYTPTWSALDLVDWTPDHNLNIASYDRSKFDDYVVQPIPLEHHELSTLTREKIMYWLNKQFNFTVNYNLLEGGYTAADNHQAVILRGLPVTIQPKNVTVNGLSVRYDFSNWEDGSIDNPRTFFTSRDVSRTAIMKAHLATNNNATLASTNQEKLMRFDGTDYFVYESAGEIWFTTSGDGISWSPEKRLSDGTGNNLNPSLSVSSEGPDGLIVRVVWVRSIESSAGVVKYREYRPVHGWLAEESVPPTVAGSINANQWTPVVSSYGWVACNRYTHSGGSVALAKKEAGVWRTTSAPGSNAHSKAPSIVSRSAYCWIVWEDAAGGTIKHNKVQANSNGTFTWQATTNLSDGANRAHNSSPSIAWASQQDGDFYVAWHGLNSSTTEQEVIVRRGDWGEFKHFASCVPGVGYSNPVIRKAGATGMLVTWRASDNQILAARLDRTSGEWMILSTGASSDHPVALAENEGGMTGTLAYITGGSSLFAINLMEIHTPTPVTSQLQATGWNLVSVPAAVSDYHPCSVFPMAISDMFGYSEAGGYTPENILANGPGYFTKFLPSQSGIAFVGVPISALTFSVPAGWSFIGSISSPLQVSHIGTSPPGNIVSAVFELRNGGYRVADSVRPGVGYWAKMAQPGTVSLPTAGNPGADIAEEVGRYDKFLITDAGGKEQDVYVRNAELTEFSAFDTEMPPAPPDPEFDVRFESGDCIMTVHPDSGEVDIAIAINEAEYPITVAWEINPENGITYSQTGGGLGKSAFSSPSGTMVIANRESGVVRFAATATKGGIRKEFPTTYTLAQNYPNPFNPSTTFAFGLPEPATVSLVVYDILGRQIADVVSGRFEAGYHARAWNATGVASSGVYFARFTATDVSGVVKHAAVSKLLLTK